MSTVFALLIWTVTAGAAGFLPAYDEHTDPKMELATALAEARNTDKKVLVIFGSEWCSDCRTFDKQLRSSSVSTVINSEFVVIKADIGNWDKNMDFAEWFGNPASQGIPSIAIIDPNRRLYSATPGNELAMLRHRSVTQLTDWFSWYANGLHENEPLAIRDSKF
ncbi:thioredoxin family protein [Pseudomonadota bacterium]